MFTVKSSLGISLLLFAYPGQTANPAPEITITVAEKQEWSGGIAGRTGYYYHIEFSTYANGKGAAPDTVWIGKKHFPLTLRDVAKPAQAGGNCILTKGKHNWTYSLSVNDDESISNEPGIMAALIKGDNPKPPAYKGVAAISYVYKGKRKVLPIISFKQLPAIAYP